MARAHMHRVAAQGIVHRDATWLCCDYYTPFFSSSSSSSSSSSLVTFTRAGPEERQGSVAGAAAATGEGGGAGGGAAPGGSGGRAGRGEFRGGGARAGHGAQAAPGRLRRCVRVCVFACGRARTGDKQKEREGKRGGESGTRVHGILPCYFLLFFFSQHFFLLSIFSLSSAPGDRSYREQQGSLSPKGSRPGTPGTPPGSQPGSAAGSRPGTPNRPPTPAPQLRACALPRDPPPPPAAPPPPPPAEPPRLLSVLHMEAHDLSAW